jgi:hypothetical protein
MTNFRKLFYIAVPIALLMPAALAAAGNGPRTKVVNSQGVQEEANEIFITGTKGTQTAPVRATVRSSSSGTVTPPSTLQPPSDPNAMMVVWICPDGKTIYHVLEGVPDPCPGDNGKRAGAYPWNTTGTVVINKDAPEGQGVTIEPETAVSHSAGLGSSWMYGAPNLQLSLGGGGGSINGNYGPTIEGKAAFFIPIRDCAGFGPFVGLDWANPVTGWKFGSMTPGSTFGGIKAGSWAFPVGGEFWLPNLDRVQLGLNAAVLPLWSKFEENFGFCPTSGGCIKSSTSYLKNTLVGYRWGADLSFRLSRRLSFFGEYYREAGLKFTSGTMRFNLQSNVLMGGMSYDLPFGR